MALLPIQSQNYKIFLNINRFRVKKYHDRILTHRGSDMMYNNLISLR